MKNLRKKNLAKILVLVLSVILVVTALVLVVGAETTPVAKVTIGENAPVEYDSMDKVIEDVYGKEATVELLSDATMSSRFNIAAATTINLNGYTLTSDAAGGDRAFQIGGHLKLIGSGTLLVNNTTAFVTASGHLEITGGEKPINIIKAEDATAGSMFAIAGADVTVKNAVFELKNQNAGQPMFYVNPNGTGTLNFEGVEFIATNGPDTVSNSQAVFTVGETKDGHNLKIRLSYCSMLTDNLNAFCFNANSVRIEDFLRIENSRLEILSHNKANTTLFMAWVNIASDFLVKDSYVEYGGKTAVNGNINGSAIIFDNTVVASAYKQDSNNNFFRQGNVIFQNGSALIDNYENKGISSNAGQNPSFLTVGDATQANVLINEGTRFDLSAKNKVMALSDGQVVFPDGVAPKSNTNYVMVYDPAGNLSAPYVLRAVGDTGTPTEYAEHISTNITQYWGGQDAGTHSEPGSQVGFNRYYKFTKTEGSADNTLGLISGKNNTFDVREQKIAVFEYDVSANSEGGFAPFNYYLHVRDTSGGDSARVNLYTVNNSGLLLAPNYSGGETNSIKLRTDEWNHITLVLDTTSATADSSNATSYLYVNGIYLGTNSTKTYNTNTGPLHGQRWEVPKGCPIGATLMLDNGTTRVYTPEDDGNGNYIPLTKEGADSYLINGGKVSNKMNISGYINISGVPFETLDEALSIANEKGLLVSLKGDIYDPQNITVEGNVLTNGFSVNLAENSFAAKDNKDSDGNSESLTFKAEYSAYKATYKFNIGTDKVPVFTSAVEVNVNAVPELPTLSADEQKKYNALEYGYLHTDGKYYKTTSIIGWTETKDHFSAEYDIPLNVNKVEEFINSGEEFIPLYPVYAPSTTTPYDSIVVDGADGSFIRGVNTNAGVIWWNGNRNAIALQYGETLKLQRDVVTQDAFYNKPGYSFIGGTAHPTLGKTYGIDLNGYTLTFDRNAGQIVMNDTVADGYLTINAGETLNIYSSASGGKIESYSVHTIELDHEKLVEDGGIKVMPETQPDGSEITNHGFSAIKGVTQAEYNEYKAKAGSKYIKTDDGYTTMHTINVSGWSKTGTNDDGVEIGRFDLTERYEQIIDVASGFLVNIPNSTDAHLNIGKHGDIPGSNLTLEAATIFKATTGTDNTGSIKIDGAKIIRNSSTERDYVALFILNRYSGTFVVENSTIITPEDNDFIYGNVYEGEDEIGSVVVKDSTVIVKNDGEAILYGYFNNPVNFSGVTTNGAVNKADNATVTLGEGNKYVSTSAILSENIENAIYDTQMQIPENAVDVTYVTLISGHAYSNENDFDYNVVTYHIVLDAEDANVTADANNVIKVLPILGYMSTNAENTATLVYNDLDGNAIVTEVYVKGTATRNTTVEIPEKILNALKVTATGFDADVPAVMNTDAILNPEYEVKSTVSGVKANVSVYSDFGINIYLPAYYAEFITVKICGEVANTSGTVVIDGITYNAYTAYRKAYKAEDNVAVSVEVAENGYSAVSGTELNVVTYAQTVIAMNEDKASTDVQLMYHMLKYAQASNSYFADKIDGVAVSENISSILSAAIINEYDYTLDAKDTTALENSGILMTIDLDSENLSYVFANVAEGTTVTLAGKTYEAVDGTITISGLKVYTFGMDFQINIGDTSYDYNLATFVKQYEGKTEFEIVNSFYQYAEAASAYKTK